MCVLGLGLIGGSLLRAATAAGYRTFGYNRGLDGAQAARADGFDVSTDLTATLARAAEADALIVIAVPMPALAHLLDRIANTAPGCPLTDVIEEQVASVLRNLVGTYHLNWVWLPPWSAQPPRMAAVASLADCTAGWSKGLSSRT